MKHTYSLLSLFLFTTLVAKAQSVSPDVVASAGDLYANSSGQLQWTLGEVMTETFQSTDNILTQGFHQPFNLVSGIAELSTDNIASVYPNPATDKVSINFNTLKGTYHVSVIDVTGKVLQSEDVATGAFGTHDISVKGYSNGMYFIQISNPDNNYNQTIRIIKTN